MEVTTWAVHSLEILSSATDFEKCASESLTFLERFEDRELLDAAPTDSTAAVITVATAGSGRTTPDEKAEDVSVSWGNAATPALLITAAICNRAFKAF